MKKKYNILKLMTLIFFFAFIFIVPLSTLFTEDKKISEIENKILTQFPQISLEDIYSKRFFKDFDKYTSDQFPLRANFLEIKNSFSYLVGQREFREIYLGKKHRLMEKFVFNKDIIDKNISQVINMSKYVYDKYNISSTLMIVPNSIAFYKDELPSWAITDNQYDTLNYINNNIKSISKDIELSNGNSFINFYTPYSVLNKYKQLPIYFNTDHHWTQLGAKIAYDDMNNTLNIDNISKDYNKVSNNFYGTYYSKAMLPMIKGDDIYSYDKYNNFNITIDFNKKYNTLYDKDKLSGKNKYQYFLHGDPGICLIDGSGYGEILIFKDSYAHNFIPFLAYDYAKIHVIDPRYYKVDIDKYLSENNIDKILYIHNLQSINTYNLYRNIL